LQCGETDTSPTPQQCQNIADILTGKGTTVNNKLYPGVGHAFVDTECLDNVQEECGKAWQDTKEFLNTELNGSSRILTDIKVEETDSDFFDNSYNELTHPNDLQKGYVRIDWITLSR